MDKDYMSGIKLLQKADLLLNILKEVQKNVVGEENAILVIINKIALRLVKNTQATSSNILVSDLSGGGKDNLVKSVCQVMLTKEKNYFHRTSLSEKVLNYWNPGKDEDKDEEGTWNGKVLVVEDPKTDLLKSDAFRTMSSGGNYAVTVDINRKLQSIKINGKPVIIITSVNAEVDDEGNRRWDAVRLDTSEILTEKVKEFRAKLDAGLLIEYDKELNSALSKNLRQVEVVVTHAEELVNLLPNTLIMRTQSSKLIDYIKASAALHQHQRKESETGAIIAEEFDYWFGLITFVSTNKIGGTALNIYEEEIIKLLGESTKDEPLIVKEIINTVSSSKNKVYRLLMGLTDKGLIKRIDKFDPAANRDVAHFYPTSVAKNEFGCFGRFMVVLSHFSLGSVVVSVDSNMYNKINTIRHNQHLPLVEFLFPHTFETSETTKQPKEKQAETTKKQAKQPNYNPLVYYHRVEFDHAIWFEYKITLGEDYVNIDIRNIDRLGDTRGELEFDIHSHAFKRLLNRLFDDYGNKFSYVTGNVDYLFINKIPTDKVNLFLADLETMLHCPEIYILIYYIGKYYHNDFFVDFNPDKNKKFIILGEEPTGARFETTQRLVKNE